MDKKFEVNQTKIKRGCQSYTKAAPWETWRDLTLENLKIDTYVKFPLKTTV